MLKKGLLKFFFLNMFAFLILKIQENKEFILKYLLIIKVVTSYDMHIQTSYEFFKESFNIYLSDKKRCLSYEEEIKNSQPQFDQEFFNLLIYLEKLIGHQRLGISEEIKIEQINEISKDIRSLLNKLAKIIETK